jgi:diguanylate cyclase (GGDEF)-like protein
VKLYQFKRLTWSLAKEKDQYRELSKIDSLTGLMNRHGLNEDFREEIRNQLGDYPVSLMFIDIDHFKSLNDTYGHHLGDEVLRRVAHCIGEHSRQSDKAVRWGGEEFLLLMPGTPAAEARMAAERLRKAVENLAHPELGSRSVTVSIGLGEIRLEETLEQALERADQALYRAKASGRNRVVQTG